MGVQPYSKLHIHLSRKELNMRTIIKLLKQEKGATSIEYSLIASLIAMAIVGTVTTVGGAVLGLFELVANSFP